jgi:hypothetical protein
LGLGKREEGKAYFVRDYEPEVRVGVALSALAVAITTNS